MKFEGNNKWEPIQNPDITKRSPIEWANIYGLELLNPINGYWNEYEWAYNFPNLDYVPKKSSDGLYDWDSISDKENRAQFLRRDLFLGADLGEKEILKEKYIETNWVRTNIMGI